jgi:hypothetical protein
VGVVEVLEVAVVPGPPGVPDPAVGVTVTGMPGTDWIMMLICAGSVGKVLPPPEISILTLLTPGCCKSNFWASF